MPIVVTECPYCFQSHRIDSDFLGRPITCVNPKCKRTFKSKPSSVAAAGFGPSMEGQAGSGHVSASDKTASAVSPEFDEWVDPGHVAASDEPWQAALGLKDLPPVAAPAHVSAIAKMRATATRPVAPKYANLTGYLSVVAMSARIILFVGVVCGLLAAYFSQFTLLAVLLVSSIGYYVVTMASVEFFRVIIDIETNTRSISEALRRE